jgi:uncharacterized protein YndB with AHSA1/START domain
MASATDETLVLTRTFAAPRALVWKAFTEQERLAAWWGPKGFRMLSCKLDLSVGGIFLYGMEGPDGKAMWGRWLFTGIAPPERLAFVASFSNPEGEITRAPFFDNWPLEVSSSFEFKEEGGKTVVTMTGVPINARDDERARFLSLHDSMRMGWGGTFDQLEAYLAGASG